ncbi:MAG: alpha/beta hydrolase [Planctomycetia bacterium]|nr:alpha/beta hydrolase [Planctomycetia bacterium]
MKCFQWFTCLVVALALSCCSLALAADAANEVINIWPDGAAVTSTETEQVAVNLYVFLPDADKATGQGVIICPGGGYSGLCIEPEGYGIAKWLNAHGIAGFVLEYRLPHGRPYVPLNDAARAIRTVRSGAQRFQVNENKIGIIGFSAGGHLASTAATHFDAGDPNATDPVERVSSRPDFAILIYPVVTFGEHTHSGTQKNLLGELSTPELIEYFSNEKQVDEQTPPTFLAHAVDDGVVPIANSLNYVEAMKKFSRPVKWVELPNGNHGLNGYKGASWDRWQSECIDWLKSL